MENQDNPVTVKREVESPGLEELPPEKKQRMETETHQSEPEPEPEPELKPESELEQMRRALEKSNFELARARMELKKEGLCHAAEKAHHECQLGEARSESAKLRADIDNIAFHQMEVNNTKQRLEALLKEYNKTVEEWNEGTKRDMEESKAWNEKFILYERSHSELAEARDTIATLGAKLERARETIKTLGAKLKAIREVTSDIL